MCASLISLINAAVRSVRAFMGSRAASAAVEFAVVLPVALGLYLGAAEVTQGVMTARKVNLLTRTLADLLSHQQTSLQSTSTPTPANALTAAQLGSLMTASQVLLTPQPTTTLQMTLSAIDITANPSTNQCCVAKVRWSFTQGGTLRPCNTTLTGSSDGTTNSPTTISNSLLPTGTLLVAPISVLVADVNYTFQPLLQLSFMPFAPTFSRIEYMYPRSPGQVVVGTLPGSGTQNGQVCY